MNQKTKKRLPLIARRMWWAALCAMLLAPSAIFADIVFYRNQRYIKGKVVGQTIDSVLFRAKDGRTLKILKRKIRKILYIPVHRQSELDRAATERRKRAEERRRRDREARLRAEKEKQEREAKERAAGEKARRAAAAAREKARVEKLRRDKNRGRDALYRSAVLPGWGQHYLGQSWRRNWFAGGAIAGTFLTYYYYRRFLSRRADYDFQSRRTLLEFDNVAVLPLNLAEASRARGSMKRAANRSNLALNLLLGIYIWNLADIYFDFPAAGDAPTLRMQYTIRF